MFEIICSEMSLYSSFDPLMIDFMNIMNDYNKAIIILEHSTGNYYINNVTQSIFSYQVDTNYVRQFLDKVNFLSTSQIQKFEEVEFELLNIKVKISFKQIGEKQTLKYTICTIEEVLNVLESNNKFLPNEKLLYDIIGESTVINTLKNKIKKVAATDSTVLLMGETGTGKELFARTIHQMSARSNKPFIAINCGAIPDTLIESELFGYEKGSFTGANLKGKSGKFEQANGGTIFLDEIENMSVLLQMKLLRVLEERKVMKVGGVESISVDIRIIAATNHNLMDMIKRNEFRKDLYYRLNIVKLNIPNLKERHEDIILISRHFIRIFSKKMNKQVFDLSEEVKGIFLNHIWDGNVRELRNSIEYAMNFEESGYITLENLPEQFTEDINRKIDKPVFKTIVQIEREHITKALDYYGWDDKGKQKVAEILEISRSSIYRKTAK